MSRSEEKAKATLNRWRQLSSKPAGDGRPKRVHASECNSLTECEATRKRLVEQIASKIEQIQRMVPDEACKRLNDEINTLIRIKGHWERQIRALGGHDYRQDKDGHQSSEYMYFGGACELPEVKAVFKRKETDALTSGSLGPRKRVSVDPGTLSIEYYGFDDNELQEEEKQAEEICKIGMEGTELRPQLPHWSETWKPASNADVQLAILSFRKQQLLQRFSSVT